MRIEKNTSKLVKHLFIIPGLEYLVDYGQRYIRIHFWHWCFEFRLR